MSTRSFRCPYCSSTHAAGETVCPTTGRRFGGEVAQRRTHGAGGRAHEPPRELPASSSFRHHMLVGQTVGGRYRIRGVLGEGGMGTVYDAEHIGLGRAVAIKVLSPSQSKKRVAVKRFQQEARAAGAIGHPNICEVYDLGVLDDGSPYLVMEKLVGRTLSERINREGGLPFDELAEIMVQVLSGLIAAHEKGIVHRDVKPENVFLAQRPGVGTIAKILDFGISKMMPQFQGGDLEALDLTRTGMVMGTPYYMSPEQARGERNLDGRVDVYACGVLMYEAISARRPFTAPNYNALLLAIITTDPVPLREIRPAIPSRLEAIVARAMTKPRGRRYPSALDMLRDIQALNLSRSGSGPSRMVHAESPRPKRRPSSRRLRAERALAQDPDATVVDPPPDHAGRGQEYTAGSRGSRMPDPPTRTERSPRETRSSRRSPSVEIPIHVSTPEPEGARRARRTRPDTPEAARAWEPPPDARRARESLEHDDMPTEIFRPSRPPPAPAPPARVPRRAPPPPASAEDWDDKTIKMDKRDFDFDFDAPPRRRK